LPVNKVIRSEAGETLSKKVMYGYFLFFDTVSVLSKLLQKSPRDDGLFHLFCAFVDI
jgi:hypothetical protein